MKRTLDIELKDKREIFDIKHTKKPYYLYVEWNNRNFYFSNKKKAERFLASFKKVTTEIYRELSFMLFDCFKLNLIITDSAFYANTLKHRNNLMFYADRYSHYFHVNSDKYKEDYIEAGDLLKSVYSELITQLNYYRYILRKSNRNKYLYEDVRHRIKKAKRIRSEIDILLTGADGINEIATDKLDQMTFVKKVRLVA